MPTDYDYINKLKKVFIARIEQNLKKEIIASDLEDKITVGQFQIMLDSVSKDFYDIISYEQVVSTKEQN